MVVVRGGGVLNLALADPTSSRLLRFREQPAKAQQAQSVEDLESFVAKCYRAFVAVAVTVAVVMVIFTGRWGNG